MNKSINELKILTMDSISNANSGHPGMALGSATAMYTLFNKVLNICFKEDKWINRDRFILSSGHVSSLLYSLLHLSGFDISIEDLKSFRKLNSLTPGHPEYKYTHGVDATTGPLGQGLTMAVGMAMGERIMASKFNKPDFNLYDHYTFVLCGDGDLQEGVSQEAISFAGNLNLNKLIILYDSNDVTLDGPLSDSFNEDVEARFKASNFSVVKVKSGNDEELILKALKKAKRSNKPTIIIFKSIIGDGSLNEGKSITHGSPLGKEDLMQLRTKLKVSDKPFCPSQETYQDFKDNIIKRGNLKLNKWNKLLKKYKQNFPSDYKRLTKALNNEINYSSLDNYICELNKSDSTRNSSGRFLNLLANDNDFIIGGSADVASSVKTKLNAQTTINKDDFSGQNINFGIREFAMSCISNGLSLYGGIKPFIGSFLVFADYMKPSLRLASLMSLPQVYLFSHDSIAVGEDGPTHQPIEHLAMLRSIPGFSVIRPSNELETKFAYKIAFSSLKPTAIILTRQNVETLNLVSEKEFLKGAYFIKKDPLAKYTLLATGSEVGLALNCYQRLLKDDIKINIVSFPSFDLFENQSNEYKDYILNNKYENTISLEMLSSFGWSKYAKHNISVDFFGKSGAAKDVITNYGFDELNIYNKIKSIIK